jgi:hypothetical protein
MVGAIRKNLFFGSRNVSNLPTPRVIEACKIVEAYIKEVIEEREVVA